MAAARFAEMPTHRTPIFGTVLTAMVTPFGTDGSLDLDAAQHLAKGLVSSGSDGLVVAGTTGEGSTLTDDEKLDLFQAVAEAVTVPVLAGSSSNDTPHSIELTRRAAQLPISGHLVVTPYYNRPSQAGILGHFEAVARATSKPLVCYDIPVRTGRRIERSTLAELSARCSNVVAVKDATGDVAAAAQSICALGDAIQFYCGDDSLTLAFAAVGAVGVISVASHWAAPLFQQLFEAYRSGDVLGAMAVNQQLFSSYTFQSSEEFPNPLPAKAAMRTLGYRVGQCRLPMGEAPLQLDHAAAAMLDGLPAHRG